MDSCQVRIITITNYSTFRNLSFNIRYETVTKVDVDNVRQHLRPPPPLLSISSWELNLMEKPTSDHPEEHTNLIPHIPNYWTPADTYPGNYLYLSPLKNVNTFLVLHGKYLGKYLHLI